MPCGAEMVGGRRNVLRPLWDARVEGGWVGWGEGALLHSCWELVRRKGGFRRRLEGCAGTVVTHLLSHWAPTPLLANQPTLPAATLGMGSKFESIPPPPPPTPPHTMKTTFRMRATPPACTSCSMISPAVRSAVRPMVPVAQNVHPMAQPTCRKRGPVVGE